MIYKGCCFFERGTPLLYFYKIRAFVKFLGELKLKITSSTHFSMLKSDKKKFVARSKHYCNGVEVGADDPPAAGEATQ